jgi:MoxR-like ATPase
MGRSVDKNDILRKLRAEFGDTVSRRDLDIFKHKHGIGFPYWLTDAKDNQLARGLYRVPAPANVAEFVADDATGDDAVNDARVDDVQPETSDSEAAPMSADTMRRMDKLKRDASLLSRIPEVDPTYVPFGDYDMALGVVQSRMHVPIFITGPSGNGKTKSVEQACAAAKREYIPVSITIETDEDDLIGGYRLKDGNTVFELGPVVVAMLRGAVLLLDEIDKASAKIMCLQNVVDGKPLLIKKLGIMIYPAPGFTIFATANTKGRGSEDGKFITSVLLDEAFLERFWFTIEQQYPDQPTEKNIMKKAFEFVGGKTDATTLAYFDTLAKWADGIRVTCAEGGIEDIITTRRLVQIAKAYHMFTPKYGAVDAQMWALHFCTSRFEPKTKDAMVDYYNKLAPDASAPENVGKHANDGKRVSNPGF